jgi:hypothetical protein
LTTNSIIQESAVVTSAQKIIDFIGKIKNTELTGVPLHELRTLFQILVDTCNSKPLKTFPVKIIDEPIDKIGFQIRSTYLPGLKFSEVPSFVIDSLGQAENHIDDTRCLDALRVLIDYCNIVVYSRFDRGLELEPKK